MEIEFYQDHRGDIPVQDYLDKLSNRTEINQAAVYMRELKHQGYRTQRPIAAPLRDGIYELRPGPNRILYGFVQGKIILVHALRKTRRDIPERDIDLALRRLREWEQNEKK